LGAGAPQAGAGDRPHQHRGPSSGRFTGARAHPAGPIGGAINAITGTSTDTVSGVQKVDVKYSGPMAGNICLSPGSPTAWTCNWNTVGLTDGTYTITLEVTDNAGNREGPAITRFMVVDNTPPLLTFNSFVATAGTQYQVGAGSTMYPPPAATASHISALGGSSSGKTKRP